MDYLSSSRRRQVQSDGEEDYLSNLPDELLHHILSFLPTLNSIRTSVLARRWRHVWTSVPVVDFPFLQLKPFIMKRFFDSRSCESVSLVRLSRLSKESETLVYDLIEYAKSTDVRHVTLLNFCLGHCSNSLFDLLFDWPSLVSLNLKVVCFKNCTFSKCRLSNLKTLSLKLPENTNRNESLANLLSGCPVLEELTLDAKNLFDNELFRIESPNLLRLALIPTPSNFQINCQKLEYLRLNPVFNFMYLHVEAPSLTSVRLYNIWRFGTFAPTVCDVTAVAITLSDKCHSLSGSTPKFLGKYKAVVQGFPIFYNLLELKIKMYVTDKLSLDIVLDLLRCAPNLQSLGLTAYNKRRRRDEDFDEWEKNSSSRINEPLKHLERVSVNIKSERIRSAFLKTLSDRVPAWDRVTVAY